MKERDHGAPPRAGGPGDPATADAVQDRKPAGKRRRRKRRRDRKVFADNKRGVPAAGSPAGISEPPAHTAASNAAHKAGVQPPYGRPPAGPSVHRSQSPKAAAPAPDGAYAALDLGTNNCRLLVAYPTRHRQFRVVDAFSRIVRLGEGLSASGRLSDDAMDRAVEALKVCASKLGNRPIRRARLIATEACRSAGNGEGFLTRVLEETGMQLEIIDRKTEARLAVSGCESLVERDTDGVVLFDIGGGSSEIALIDLTRGRRGSLSSHIVDWTSLPVGVVSLAEKFGGREVTAESFEAMIVYVAGLIDKFAGRKRLDHVVKSRRFHLLGTSGTVTTLAGVHLDLPKYERRRVDGLWMNARMVDDMTAKLLSWDFDRRVQNPCIGPDRADLVLAGCAILEAIRRAWPSERLRVADRGLREGILTELMVETNAWAGRGGGR